MGRVLFAVFLIVPLAEIAFFIVIGKAIGLWPTLLGVVVTAVAGSLILRWQGLQLISEIRQTMGQGRLPARALADAMMVVIAGLLLLLPGYFSDLIGILLLIPPVRTLIYRALASRVQVMTPTSPTGYGFGPRRVED
ncbi:MAG: FxsA family protein, partial [Alphaproteobacteria bacterium]